MLLSTRRRGREELLSREHVATQPGEAEYTGLSANLWFERFVGESLGQ